MLLCVCMIWIFSGVCAPCVRIDRMRSKIRPQTLPVSGDQKKSGARPHPVLAFHAVSKVLKNNMSSTRYLLQRLVRRGNIWRNECAFVKKEEAIETYRQLKADYLWPDYYTYRIVEQKLVAKPGWVDVKIIKSEMPL